MALFKSYTKDTPRDDPETPTPYEIVVDIVKEWNKMFTSDVEGLREKYATDSIIFSGPPLSPTAALAGPDKIVAALKGTKLNISSSFIFQRFVFDVVEISLKAAVVVGVF